jgi:hypothetical protein
MTSSGQPKILRLRDWQHDYFDAYLFAIGCQDCRRSVRRPAHLRFDHVRLPKVANVSRLLGRAWVTVITEVSEVPGRL